MSTQTDKNKPEAPQDDDMAREEQKSHDNKQNRSKKQGHVSQIGSGLDQQSGRRGSHDPLNRKR